MKKTPKRRTNGSSTSEQARLKPVNNFAAMERMIAAVEESAHLEGMSIFHMLIAANAITAAALRQIMASSAPDLLATINRPEPPVASDELPAGH